MGRWIDSRGRWLLGAACVLLVVMLTDELVQSDEPLTPVSVLFELLDLLLLVGCSATSAALVLRVRAQEEESLTLREDIAHVRAESRQWREEMADHLRELGSAIRRQFEDWRLTAAEQDVGLLLLKGFSHKEIARLRRTGEATIRQQAASIYQKAGLGGRAALSAFFLDDLLAGPPAARPTATGDRHGSARP